ncbi:MAG: DinB family protein [Alphaproteobacteria bacterium]|nr:DinB family protein [Alphaproteobacteria bacterium]
MTQTNLEEMITQMEQAVEEGLAYLEQASGGTSPQVDRWTAKEVLAHMVYWHRASLQGIESVSGGGPPFQVPSSSDVINDEIVADLSETSVSQMAEDLRDLQKRLSAAARLVPNLDDIVFIRVDGQSFSTRIRVETITNHWRDHVRELQAADSPSS